MNEQLAAIKARREAATPGVWETVRANNDVRIWRDGCIIAILPDTMPYYTTAGNTDADAAFIAAAPADIDTLLAHVAALTAERDALAQQLQQAQDAAKRQAAYISECVDSDGCYRP